ncbi:MAG TPA: phosphoribosyltransferase [Candidatus Binatia bacterium]|nr:phosphoribosyltransferase [Candidatus Binatia bacterium]
MVVNIYYEVPTWNQIYEMLLSQAQKIQSKNYKPDIIVGVARGGIVPARILTDLLETSELSFIQIEFYTDINQTQMEPALKQPLATQIANKKVLLVDDIADSGRSLKLAKNHLQQQGAIEIQTAVLYQKPQSTTTPNFFEKRTTHWIVFPWDTKETIRRIIQRQGGKKAANNEVSKLIKAGLSEQVAEKLLKDVQQGTGTCFNT